MTHERTHARGRIAAIVLLIATLGACVGPARESVNSASGVGRGDTVVVGRIEFVPPLREGEQRLRGIGSGRFKDKIFMITDDRYRELTQEPGPSDFSGRIEATLGKTFFVRSDNKPFFILLGMMWLELGANQNKIYVPGGLKIAIKPGDKAVYIGTVQYHRDEFFTIKKTLIVDDYRRANAEYKKKFGTQHSLRKALLTTVKR